MSEVVSDGSVVPVANIAGAVAPIQMLRGWWTRSFSSGDTEGPAPATAATLPIGQSRRFLEYVHEHLPGQLAGLRVLIRRMIRSQNDLPVRQRVLRPVAKLI